MGAVIVPPFFLLKGGFVLKHLYKLLIAVVIVMGFVGVCHVREAEAAYTSEGVYYPDLWTEVDWGEYANYKEDILKNNSHLIVSHVQEVDVYSYAVLDSESPVYLDVNNMGNSYYLVNTSASVYVLDGKVISFDISTNSTCSIYHTKDYNSGLDRTVSILGSTYDYRGSLLSGFPYSNLLYEPGYTIMTSVDIKVDDVYYTVSEPLPYYLGLKDIRGNILLLFSDEPFTGSMYDLYKSQFSVSPASNVISYLYSVSSNNDFLESRSVSIGYDSFLTTMKDYFCNYHIHLTDDLLNVFLQKKECFDVEVSQTLESLCVNFPEELKEYTNFIIFQQTSKTAYDDRIIFYGWKDVFADLFINKRNSQMCAIGKKGAVSDYITAYFDESQAVWIVSDDVVLGATTDVSYSVPYIYYTNSTLFVCDSAWENTGDIVQMANMNPPPFLENSDGSEENNQQSLLDKFVNGFLTGNTNLLKYLFIPSEGYFTVQLTELQSYFGFWTSVRDTANVFMDFLKTTDFNDPPKIEIDLSLAKTSVDYGGKVYLIDLSWYEPYKGSVDVILSSILWLVFIWNTYKNLPNIIAGIGGGVQASASLFDDGKEE